MRWVFVVVACVTAVVADDSTLRMFLVETPAVVSAAAPVIFPVNQ